jgi:hypothetical protein
MLHTAPDLQVATASQKTWFKFKKYTKLRIQEIKAARKKKYDMIPKKTLHIQKRKKSKVAPMYACMSGEFSRHVSCYTKKPSASSSLLSNKVRRYLIP